MYIQAFINEHTYTPMFTAALLTRKLVDFANMDVLADLITL